MEIVHIVLLIKKADSPGATNNNEPPMFKSILKCLPVILGALYLIVDANDMDYDYAWDHSVYPPFTGKLRK